MTGVKFKVIPKAYKLEVGLLINFGRSKNL